MIRETLIEMCRPFGRIESWQVESANDGLYRCSLKLEQPETHEAIAGMLGAELTGEALSVEIRVRR